MDRRQVRELMRRLECDAAHIARRFELRYRSLEPERPHVTGHYGLCTSDGVIKIRLRHATTGRPLKYSSLVSTLCHELAHLRHFDHGPRFRAFYQRLLEYARAEEIYRPRTAAAVERVPTAAAVERVPTAAAVERVPTAAHPSRGASGPLRPRGPVQLDLF